MKQDTLEEKIVADFEAKTDAKNFPTEEHHRKGGDHLLDPEEYPESDYELDRDKIIDWLRTTFTSYRNDVLEEAHDEIKKLDAYGDGQIAFKHRILEVIKSLKVDIIKR